MNTSRIKTIVTIFVALLMVASFVEGYRGVVPADPNNPGKCIYRGDELNLGVNVGPVPCQRLTCYEDGSILIEGCGRIRLQDCNHGERLNANKPYPECCKLRYKCKRPDGSSYYQENATA